MMILVVIIESSLSITNDIEVETNSLEPMENLCIVSLFYVLHIQ